MRNKARDKLSRVILFSGWLNYKIFPFLLGRMEGRALRYTLSSRRWLERRYRKKVGGIYFAHQPIYGFEYRHLCDPGATERYVCTYRILSLLSSLRFSSLLDVGGGEGYRAALVKKKVKDSEGGSRRSLLGSLPEGWEAFPSSLGGGGNPLPAFQGPVF
jgi:hypothetical protein